MSYLTDWWTAFENMRRTNKIVLDAYVTRLAVEHLSAASSSGDEESEKSARPAMRESVGHRSKLGQVAAAMRLLRWMWRQRLLLKAAFAVASYGPTGLVALSTKRLPLAESSSPRTLLRAYARALPGSSTPDRIGNELDMCGRLLLFEPQRMSPLWANPQACWGEHVFVIDYAFIVLMLATAPLRTAMDLWAHRGHLLASLRQGQGRGLKPVLASIMFAVAYRGLLAEAGWTRAFILAANSFATEVLRVFLIHAPQCTEICEILHGVPTLELEDYLATLFRFAPSSSKHRFVPMISGLPLYGVYASSVDADPGFAINTGLNKYFLARCARGAELGGRFAQDYERLLGRTAGRQPLIVAITGANSHDKDYFGSNSFAVEQAIIRHTLATLKAAGGPFVLCYTPHPLHAWSALTNESFFAEHDVRVYPDTMFTWLVADLCIALHSSALFEAAFAGAKVFTPMRSDDRLYPPSLLNCLSHAGPNESSLGALARFLESNSNPPGDDLGMRIKQRAARLWSMDRPTLKMSETDWDVTGISERASKVKTYSPKQRHGAEGCA